LPAASRSVNRTRTLPLRPDRTTLPFTSPAGDVVMRSFVLASLIAASLAPIAAVAQEQGLTLAQVERKYRTMNEVHILKCDYDGDQIFTKTEMICVQSLYRSLYVDRN
jgi:hypothetical protein